MNHAKPLLACLFSALLIGGCNTNGSKTAATEADYQQAIADAKISLKKAHNAANEWRDTGKIIKESEKAAKSGDFTTATKLANKARQQGELALAQAHEQMNAGPRY